MNLKFFKTKLLVVIFLFTIIACSQKPKPVNLTSAEKAEWNAYFTFFSEIFTAPFQQDSISDKDLIHFGVFYNLRYHYKLFQPIDENKSTIRQDQVADTAMKYFGKKINVHQNIPDVEYNNKLYIIQLADGEAFPFSQIESLVDNGNGIFVATLNIFTASSGWTGDINANPDIWKKNNQGEDVPQFSGKMIATIKKSDDKAGNKYILIAYKKL